MGIGGRSAKARFQPATVTLTTGRQGGGKFRTTPPPLQFIGRIAANRFFTQVSSAIQAMHRSALRCGTTPEVHSYADNSTLTVIPCSRSTRDGQAFIETRPIEHHAHQSPKDQHQQSQRQDEHPAVAEQSASRGEVLFARGLARSVLFCLFCSVRYGFFRSILFYIWTGSRGTCSPGHTMRDRSSKEPTSATNETRE